MSIRELLACSLVVLLSGCVYNARERADQTVANIVSHPYDVTPGMPLAPAAATASDVSKISSPGATGSDKRVVPAIGAEQPADGKNADGKNTTAPTTRIDVKTSKYLLVGYETELPEQPAQAGQGVAKFEPRIPSGLPGSEAKAIELPRGEAAKQQAIKQLFPKLPPLADDPVPLPGPDGHAFTLSDLQQMAAANSPELRQAAADVESARGLVLQARTYPNPTVGWQVQPSNDNSTAGLQGPFIDQVIKTGGKLKLASAAAEMDLRNAELALRRTRSDLATRVRNAYYAHLVAKETVRVNRSLAEFTDDIYRLHTGLLEAGNVASYEPMALRAQAYAARLAHQQSVQTYIYSWKQLVATLGMKQMPLTQVEGRIDVVIPYFDYDTVLAYVLRNHTDVLTARNTLDKARYQLKFAQVTPVPDVDVNIGLMQDYVVEPKQFVHTATIGIPFPIWDQNKGNIIAAEGGLIRATEEPHRVEVNLTESLNTAYASYRTNLQALEYFRNHILPDQVRAYRGVLERRQLDQNMAFSDLFSSQQTLSTFVTSYLGLLNSLWSSAVNVADLLQTDDLFGLAQPQAIPALPDLGTLLPLPCCHQCATGGVVIPPGSPAGTPYEPSANKSASTTAVFAKVKQPTTGQPRTQSPAPQFGQPFAQATAEPDEPESIASFGTLSNKPAGQIELPKTDAATVTPTGAVPSITNSPTANATSSPGQPQPFIIGPEGQLPK